MSDKRPILTYEAQINRVLPGLIPEIREQVLADAKARIEGLRVDEQTATCNLSWLEGNNRAIDDCLAALTQPQTEKKCACVGPENALKPDEWHSPTCGGGAATAAGVADADPVARITKKVNESLGAELADACDHIRALIGGDVGAILYAREWLEEHDHEEREPGPYAKAFREKFPVPEFPGIEKEES